MDKAAPSRSKAREAITNFATTRSEPLSDMAGHLPALSGRSALRFFDPATVLNHRAACTERTSCRRRKRTREVSFQDYPVSNTGELWICDRRRGQQCPRIGVLRVSPYLVTTRDLDQVSKVHHGNPVGDMLDDTQVVTDEQVGHAELGLQIFQGD